MRAYENCGLLSWILGKSVPLEEAKYGNVSVPGGYRIFHVCPHCGHEINDKVGLVDDNGNPIPTEQ